MIGNMTMPMDFQYRDVFLKGKPRHKHYDDFSIRYPPMDNGQRAKIFSPFDALKGFSGAIAAKDIPYEAKTEPDPDEAAELDRRLKILKKLTCNSRMARRNAVQIKVTYYKPCSDENSDAFGCRGSRTTLNGICSKVDNEITRTLLVSGISIDFDDIMSIESNGDLFKKGGDTEDTDDFGRNDGLE